MISMPLEDQFHFVVTGSGAGDLYCL
jgi:hypothetical protein